MTLQLDLLDDHPILFKEESHVVLNKNKMVHSILLSKFAEKNNSTRRSYQSMMEYKAKYSNDIVFLYAKEEPHD